MTCEICNSEDTEITITRYRDVFKFWRLKLKYCKSRVEFCGSDCAGEYYKTRMEEE